MRWRTRPTPAAAAVAALLVWSFFPVVLLLRHAVATHASWTGADGLIGADGVLGVDQLQYLAWARSIAGHGLAADLFTLGPAGHVYLEPASGITGGLVALGLGLVPAYLLVKALATVALGLAAAAWAARLAPGRGARLAVIALALFTVTPGTALVNWLQLGSARFRFDVYLLGDELLPATKLWGYVPAALALALLPAALLALERGLGDAGAVPRARHPRRALGLAAAAGLLCAWLHPWQGITLAIVVIVLGLVRRRRAELPGLAVVLVATLLPLAYYVVLSHADPAWRMASVNEHVARPGGAVLALCLGPLVLLAAPGVRRPDGALAEQALLAWVPAALVAYWVNGAFATHALQGVTLPLAVLGVRGARRVRLPGLLGVGAALLLIVPGLAYDARKFVRTADSPLVQYALPDADAAALRELARAPAGGVLAPTPFASVIPSRTGRAVWVGHGDWSPHYRLRAREVDRLFDGRLAPAAARALVRASGARLLVADCAHPASLQATLGPLLAGVHRAGCARIYVLRTSALRTSARRARR